MNEKPASTPSGMTGSARTRPGREDRLKAALKANMARRKAQARARTQDEHPGERPDGGGQEGHEGSNGGNKVGEE